MISSLLIPALKIIGGFVFLIWGADRFVVGAAGTAKNLNISPLVIGLIVVGLATSAPEMMVSTISSFQGRTGIAIGNALGSNIANITLILGITALILPLSITSQVIKRELPLLLLVTVGSAVLLLDNQLTQLDGFVLLLGIILVLTWMVKTAIKERQNGLPEIIQEEIPTDDISLAKSCFCLLLGIIVLLVSSEILIQGAVSVAVYFNISGLIIGLTIIALGTSLPELAASLVAALKHHHEMVIGNVIGSNIFNLLVVLAIPGIIHPGNLPPGALARDVPIVVGVTLLFFILSYSHRNKDGRINRIEGGALVACFVAYQYLLYLSITQHWSF